MPIFQSQAVQVLVKEGRPAVEPLLDCLANDRRLTRAVGSFRDFAPPRYVIRVDEAALAALRGILNVQSLGPLTEHGYAHKMSVESRRAPWRMKSEITGRKTRAFRPAEAWFRVLEDDQATPAQWLDAAERIVEPGRANQAIERSQLEGAATINGRLTST